jgi:hypothetical protein
MIRVTWQLSIAALLVFAGPVLVGPRGAFAETPAQKCEAGKNGEAGKYAACLHKAQQKFVSGGETDTTALDEAVAKCGVRSSKKWTSLEDKAGTGVCPSEDDASAIQDFVGACVLSVEDALGGGALPLDVTTCNASLAPCATDLAACNDEASELQLILSGIITDATYGYDTPFTDGQTGLGDLMVAQQLTIPVDGFVTHLGLIGVADGTSAKLALYSDSGGAPDALLASTPATLVVEGAMELPVPATGVVAGTYWLAVIYSGGTIIPVDFNSTVLQKYKAQSFASPFPDPYDGPPSSASSNPYNLYVRM